MLNFEEIKESISQRFPMLMVDRITHIEEEKKVIGVKNITGNEICFLGHFPDVSIFPGSLVIEAAAQVSTFLFYKSGVNSKPKLNFYLGVVKDMRFLKPIVPGDQMVIEANVLRITENNGHVEVQV